MYKSLYLKFQTVDTLVTAVHYSLVVTRSCNGSWGAINKTPTLVKRSTFCMFGLRENFGV